MPDTERENTFVDAFVLPERRARYKQLLANTRRRSAFLDRLNHAFDYIPSLAHRIPGGRHSAEGVSDLLRQRGMSESDYVYIISDVSCLDGVVLPLHEALEEVFAGGFGSVVCCVAGRLAYYRAEEPACGYILEIP